MASAVSSTMTNETTEVSAALFERIQAISQDGAHYYINRGINAWTFTGGDCFAVLSAISTELLSLLKNARTRGASKLFAVHVLNRLDELGFFDIFEHSQSLLNFANKDFGFFTVCKPLGQLNKFSAEKHFDIKFNIHYDELNRVFDEIQFFTLIKALRLMLSQLYFFNFHTYTWSSKHNPASATFKNRDGKFIATPTYVDYVTILHELYGLFVEYEDNLHEFMQVFSEAAKLSKAYAEAHKADRVFTEGHKATKQSSPQLDCKAEPSLAEKRSALSARLAAQQAGNKAFDAQMAAVKARAEQRKIEEALRVAQEELVAEEVAIPEETVVEEVTITEPEWHVVPVHVQQQQKMFHSPRSQRAPRFSRSSQAARFLGLNTS